MRVMGLAGLVVFAMLLLLAACSDSDSTHTPTVPQGSATAPASASPGARLTGIAAVDSVIAVIESGGLARFTALLQTFPEKCAANPQGVGSPPKCPPGVADGSLTPQTRGIACERADPAALMAERFKHSRTLYAAFKPVPSVMFGLIETGQYAIVFTADDGFSERFDIRDAKVVGTWVSCGGSNVELGRMVADAQGAFLVPPAFSLPTPTPTPAPNSDGYPTNWRTGVSAVDLVLNAMFSGNADQLGAHLQYRKIGCITAPVGFPSPPNCKPGQAAGTPVDVFPVGSGEGHYVPKDDSATLRAQLVKPAWRLYAVYSQSPFAGDDTNFPRGSYAAIFNSPADGQALVVQIENGYLVTVVFAYGSTARQLTANVPAASFVLAPPR